MGTQSAMEATGDLAAKVPPETPVGTDGAAGSAATELLRPTVAELPPCRPLPIGLRRGFPVLAEVACRACGRDPDVKREPPERPLAHALPLRR